MADFSNSALIFLLIALPFSLWAIYSDLAFMKIRNKTVLGMMLCFGISGLFLLDFDIYLWRWAGFLIVLTIGFAANLARVLGAGDAKFTAAMALFIRPEDAVFVLLILSFTMVFGFVLHRIARSTTPLRTAFAHWESWKRRDYPMGLSLGSALILYLVWVLLT